MPSLCLLQRVSWRGTRPWRCINRCYCPAAAASSWTVGRVGPQRRSRSSHTASP
uniref:Uncharacterized protein n=1 Tax=Periophthalmus magnuspinnatus TaxID=409849 RepID=A0A3B3ZUA0_9GOBI